MSKSLRNYQKESIKEALNHLRKSNNPVLFEMSVGGGKSICISWILKIMEDQNKRALCLVSSSELVRNNSDEFRELGGNPSVYCSSLNDKSYSSNIIFATPQSMINALKTTHPLSKIIFNLIIVDECHQINFKSDKSIYMRILRHYRQHYDQMRLLGFTGTPFRGKESILGIEGLFKSKAANISTKYLIDNNYLVPPVFYLPNTKSFDFSECKIQKTGEFNGSDLQKVIDKNKRLTWKILQEVQEIMKERNVCLIFCSTKAHCFEALVSLPEDSSRIILGDTDNNERYEILTKARNKEIKYLISVNCLLTGVNVPSIDCIVWLRPTSSLLLYIQGLGRGLRLNDGKKDCLILDFAGNNSRFQDFDDPIILDALKQTRDADKPLIFQCYTCNTMNSEHARRCVGIVDNKRCDFYFEWKDCIACHGKNDITSRYCIHCNAELIDPNKKLTMIPFNAATIDFEVLETKYWIQESGKYTQVCASYKLNNAKCINESYSPTASIKSKNVFYGKFVKESVDNSSYWYPHLQNPVYLKAMLSEIKAPTHLRLKWNGDLWVILKKVFSNSPQ